MANTSRVRVVAAVFALIVGASLALVLDPMSPDYDVQYRSVPFPSGPEVVFMFFGSAACGPAGAETTVEVVGRARDLVEAQAQEQGFRFVAHGVAQNWDQRKGMTYLERFGPWDQVSLGRSWANSLVIRYLFSDSTNTAGTPGIAVVLRTLEVELGPDSLLVGYEATDEQTLQRVTGAQAIQMWVRRGAPVPFGVLGKGQPPDYFSF